MYLTLKIPLYATEYEKEAMSKYGEIFHQEIDIIIDRFNAMNRIVFYPYKWLHNTISFYSKSDVIHLAEVFYEKRKQNSTATYHPLFSLLSRSFTLKDNVLTMQFGRGFVPNTVNISVELSKQQMERLRHAEIVKLDIRKSSLDKYVARVVISLHPEVPQKKYPIHAMGVDVGMKCPAVCFTSKGKVKFIGNGREIKYHMRKLDSKYRQTDVKEGKKRGIRYHKMKNYKMYIDHCVAKEIISFALEQGVEVINLEKLTNMQKKFHKHEQLCWSYERLQSYITYKAKLAGLRIAYVDPYLTTKRCPSCNKINNVKGRDYQCRCGFHTHRDIVGAMNILHAPKIE